MNSTDLAMFNEAVSMAQAGKKAEAYIKLKSLAKTNYRDVNVLLWLAFTSPDLEESEAAIGMAANIEPDNPGIVSARNWLISEQRRKAQEQQQAVIASQQKSQTQITPPPFSTQSSTNTGGYTVSPALVVIPSQSPNQPHQLTTSLPGYQNQTFYPTQAQSNFSSSQQQAWQQPPPNLSPGREQGGFIKSQPLSVKIAGLVAIVAIGVLAAVILMPLVTKPNDSQTSSPAILLPPDSAYTSYPTDRDLITKAAIGDRVRVTATMDASDVGKTQVAFTLKGAYDIEVGGVILTFPSNGKLTPIPGQRVYFGKVVSRANGDYKAGNYLVIEVEQIR